MLPSYRFNKANIASLEALFRHREARYLPNQTFSLLKQRYLFAMRHFNALQLETDPSALWLLHYFYLPVFEHILDDFCRAVQEHSPSMLRIWFNKLFPRPRLALTECIRQRHTLLKQTSQLLAQQLSRDPSFKIEHPILANPLNRSLNPLQQNYCSSLGSPLEQQHFGLDKIMQLPVMQNLHTRFYHYTFYAYLKFLFYFIPGLLLTLLVAALFSFFLAKVVFFTVGLLPLYLSIFKNIKTWIIHYFKDEMVLKHFLTASGLKDSAERNHVLCATLDVQELPSLKVVQTILIPLINTHLVFLAEQQTSLHSLQSRPFLFGAPQQKHLAFKQEFSRCIDEATHLLERSAIALLERNLNLIERRIQSFVSTKQSFLLLEADTLESIPLLGKEFSRIFENTDSFQALSPRLHQVLNPKDWFLQAFKAKIFLEPQARHVLPDFFPQQSFNFQVYQEMFKVLEHFHPDQRKAHSMLIALSLALRGDYALDPESLDHLVQTFSPTPERVFETKTLITKLLFDTYMGQGPLGPLLTQEQLLSLRNFWEDENHITCLQKTIKLITTTLNSAPQSQATLQFDAEREAGLQMLLLHQSAPELVPSVSNEIPQKIKAYFEKHYQGEHSNLFTLFERFCIPAPKTLPAALPENWDLAAYENKEMLYFYRALMVKRLQYELQASQMKLSDKDKEILQLLQLHLSASWDWELFQHSPEVQQKPWSSALQAQILKLFEERIVSYAMVEGYFCKQLLLRAEEALEANTSRPLVGLEMPTIVIEMMRTDHILGKPLLKSPVTVMIEGTIERLKPLLIPTAPDMPTIEALQQVSRFTPPSPQKLIVFGKQTGDRERLATIKSLGLTIHARQRPLTPQDQGFLRGTFLQMCQQLENTQGIVQLAKEDPVFLHGMSYLGPPFYCWLILQDSTLLEQEAFSQFLHQTTPFYCAAIIASVLLQQTRIPSEQKNDLLSYWKDFLFSADPAHPFIALMKTVHAIPPRSIPYAELILLGTKTPALANMIALLAVTLEHRAHVWSALAIYHHREPSSLPWVQYLWAHEWLPMGQIAPRVPTEAPLDLIQLYQDENVRSACFKKVSDQTSVFAFSLLLYTLNTLAQYQYIAAFFQNGKTKEELKPFEYLQNAPAALQNLYQGDLYHLAETRLTLAQNRAQQNHSRELSFRLAYTGTTLLRFEAAPDDHSVWPLFDIHIFAKLGLTYKKGGIRTDIPLIRIITLLAIISAQNALSKLLLLALIDQVDQYPLTDHALNLQETGINQPTVLYQQYRCALPVRRDSSPFELADRNRLLTYFAMECIKRQQGQPSPLQALGPILGQCYNTLAVDRNAHPDTLQRFDTIKVLELPFLKKIGTPFFIARNGYEKYLFSKAENVPVSRGTRLIVREQQSTPPRTQSYFFTDPRTTNFEYRLNIFDCTDDDLPEKDLTVLMQQKGWFCTLGYYIGFGSLHQQREQANHPDNSVLKITIGGTPVTLQRKLFPNLS